MSIARQTSHKGIQLAIVGLLLLTTAVMFSSAVTGGTGPLATINGALLSDVTNIASNANSIVGVLQSLGASCNCPFSISGLQKISTTCVQLESFLVPYANANMMKAGVSTALTDMNGFQGILVYMVGAIAESPAGPIQSALQGLLVTLMKLDDDLIPALVAAASGNTTTLIATLSTVEGDTSSIAAQMSAILSVLTG